MRTYRVASDVAYEQVMGNSQAPGVVYAMVMPDGMPRALRGSAAMLWSLVAEEVADPVGEAARLTGVDRCVIEGEVAEFMESLVREGLLEPCSSLRSPATGVRPPT